jgi:hypothetical protein
MKLYRLMVMHGFEQQTFYQWLNETGLIVKGNLGYEVGPEALSSMETMETEKEEATGEVKKITQVKIASDQIPTLVKAYRGSGLENLYDLRHQQSICKGEWVELLDRLSVLEQS